MPKPDLDAAKEYAFGRLFLELAGDLQYHSAEHTIGGVLPAAVRLARLSGLNSNDLELLEVGAAFHDLGFIVRYENHELASARIAAQQLPHFGFDSERIERIMGLIMATRLPQSPRTLLEQILADADLDVLGRDDYFKRSKLLKSELKSYGRDYSAKDWYLEQLRFLSQHSYFTDAANALREPGKQNNIAQLKRILSESS